MPFSHNKRLIAPIEDSCPHVIRSYSQLIELTSNQSNIATNLLKQLKAISFLEGREHHETDCDACVMIKNLSMRFSHDVSMLAMFTNTIDSQIFAVTRAGEVNSASQEQFLLVGLATRSALESIVRSSTMHYKLDIKIFNKYLADSLCSFKEMKWGTLHYNIDTSEISGILEEYLSFSNRQKNKSNLYSDPFTTFKSKTQMLSDASKDEYFKEFFSETDEFYSALSDIVHGGSAFISASNFNQRSTVIGTKKITLAKAGEILLMDGGRKFTSSGHQLVELAGICQVVIIRLINQLYLPVTITALTKISECEHVCAAMKNAHANLATRVKGLSF